MKTHQDQATPKLLPCPFCGFDDPYPEKDWFGDDFGPDPDEPEYYYLRCENCGTCGPQASDFGDAFGLWNLRAGEVK